MKTVKIEIKYNIVITITTNEDKINPEEEHKKLNRLIFKIGCFEHGFRPKYW